MSGNMVFGLKEENTHVHWVINEQNRINEQFQE